MIQNSFLLIFTFTSLLCNFHRYVIRNAKRSQADASNSSLNFSLAYQKTKAVERFFSDFWFSLAIFSALDTQPRAQHRNCTRKSLSNARRRFRCFSLIVGISNENRICCGSWRWWIFTFKSKNATPKNSFFAAFRLRNIYVGEEESWFCFNCVKSLCVFCLHLKSIARFYPPPSHEQQNRIDFPKRFRALSAFWWN